jgi:hypothetical protein
MDSSRPTPRHGTTAHGTKPPQQQGRCPTLVHLWKTRARWSPTPSGRRCGQVRGEVWQEQIQMPTGCIKAGPFAVGAMRKECRGLRPCTTLSQKASYCMRCFCFLCFVGDFALVLLIISCSSAFTNLVFTVFYMVKLNSSSVFGHNIFPQCGCARALVHF